MECPVCKINIGVEQEVTCPGCGADLELFYGIDRLGRKLNRQRAIINGMIIIMAFLLAFVAALYTGLVNIPRNQDKVMLTRFAQMTDSIRSLLEDNRMLAAAMHQLSLRLDSLSQLQTETAATEDGEAGKQVNDDVHSPSKVKSTEIIHFVKKGESLRTIALKYYGDAAAYTRIMEENQIKRPDHIFVGQKLKIVIQK